MTSIFETAGFYFSCWYVLLLGHSSQIRQIHFKSKILKFLKYPPFDSLIENRKLLKFQLHSPSHSEFKAILRIFPAKFVDKMWFGAFSEWKLSLSNSSQHSANADVIAYMKSKILVSRQHFFSDVIFSATSKVQNYQNPYAQTNTCSLHISRNFKDIFKYICFTLYL